MKNNDTTTAASTPVTEALSAPVAPEAARHVLIRRLSKLARMFRGEGRGLGGVRSRCRVIAQGGQPPVPKGYKVQRKLAGLSLVRLGRVLRKAARKESTARHALQKTLAPSKREFWNVNLGFAEAVKRIAKNELAQRNAWAECAGSQARHGQPDARPQARARMRGQPGERRPAGGTRRQTASPCRLSCWRDLPPCTFTDTTTPRLPARSICALRKWQDFAGSPAKPPSTLNTAGSFSHSYTTRNRPRAATSALV